uniref:Uncharacterized protein n=1 Tax=Anguilla anguilla TaxID=7936 RepID=A0A0E9QMN9_ANGAN
MTDSKSGLGDYSSGTKDNNRR